MEGTKLNTEEFIVMIDPVTDSGAKQWIFINVLKITKLR